MNNPTTLCAYFGVKLSMLVFENTKHIEEISSNPEALKKELTDKFEEFRSSASEWVVEKDRVLEQNAFDSEVVTLDGESKLLIITMPEAKNSNESAFVGILLAEKPRFFSLQLYKDDQSGESYFTTAEYGTRGPITEHTDLETHKSIYSPKIDNPTKENFIENFKALLPYKGLIPFDNAISLSKEKSFLQVISDFFKNLFGKK